MGSCYNKVEIAAPLQLVWKVLEDFHNMSWAPNVVTSVDKVGTIEGTKVGAKRILNDAFHETLIKHDPDNFCFAYSIDDGPGPVAKEAVNNYIGEVKLSHPDRATIIEWRSTFESENPNEVTEFCDPIYQALLADLKDTLS